MMSMALAKASKDGDTAFAQTVMSVAQAQAVPLDSHIHNSVLDSHARRGAAAAFDAAWQEMSAAGYLATAASLASRAKLLAATAPPAEVYAYVHQTCIERPDVVSGHLFTIAFGAAARDGELTFDALLRLWIAMTESAVPVNSTLLSAFLAAAKTLPLEPWQVERCFAAVAALRAAGRKLQVGVLANMLQVCAASGFAVRVLDIWGMVQEDRLRVNAYVATAALVCCKQASADASAQVGGVAADVAAWLRARWLDTRGAPEPHLRNESGMRIAFNALLAYHARASPWEAGMETLRVRSVRIC
jgi:hypothetical protein